MPHCNEGYCTAKIGWLMDNRSIVSIAQDMVSICRGSYDTSSRRRNELLECLLFYKTNWTEGKDQDKVYDLTVLSLICQAVDLHNTTFGDKSCHQQ